MPPEIAVWGEHGLKGLGLWVIWKLGLRAIGAWRDVAREKLDADTKEAALARAERSEERGERQALAAGLAELSSAVRAQGDLFSRAIRSFRRAARAVEGRTS